MCTGLPLRLFVTRRQRKHLQEHREVLCVTKRRGSWQADRSKNHTRKPSKAHAQASSVSPPAQSNNTTQRQTAQHAFKGAAHASNQDTTHASLHSICQQGGTNRHAQHGPGRGQSRNRPQAHTDRKSRCRGNPRRPQARPDTTAPAHKVARKFSGLRGESGGLRRTIGPA